MPGSKWLIESCIKEVNPYSAGFSRPNVIQKLLMRQYLYHNTYTYWPNLGKYLVFRIKCNPVVGGTLKETIIASSMGNICIFDWVLKLYLSLTISVLLQYPVRHDMIIKSDVHSAQLMIEYNYEHWPMLACLFMQDILVFETHNQMLLYLVSS